jgi:peroxiredoxin
MAGEPLVRSPIGPGDALPAFALSDQAGVSVSLPLARPTVLVFFRGHW